MKIHPEGDSGKFKLAGLGPGGFRISEDANSAIISPVDFGVTLANSSLKRKFFDEIFKLLEKEKKVTVNFGMPNAKTNYFATELVSSDTVELFDKEYGIIVEVKKDKEQGLASSVTLGKTGYSENHSPNTSNDSPESFSSGSFTPPSDDFNPDDTSGGLLDGDEERNEAPGYFQTEWDASGTNSYSGSSDTGPSFFEKHFLGTDESANFNRVNIMPCTSDFVLDSALNSLFTQIVKHKRVINIPQDLSKQKYDPKGLFLYLNKKTNAIHIVLNGRKNADNEMLQSVVLSPIIVHFLKNNYTVALNYGLEDPGVLNYEVQTGNVFNLIDSKYNVETGKNITSKVQEKEEAGTIFTFAIIQG